MSVDTVSAHALQRC